MFSFQGEVWLQRPRHSGARGVGSDQDAHPDLDAGAGGGAEPVAVWAEAEGVDRISSIQSVQMLSLVQVPQHGLAVL